MLKLCDIKNLHEIKTISVLGIEFIGCHLISENDCKRQGIYKNAIKYLHQSNSKTKAILVTKEKNFTKLVSLVNELEFDGVQLHYPNSESNIVKLRTQYGNEFIIFQVKECTDSNLLMNSSATYLIVDSSYIGGTGVESKKNIIKKIVKGLDFKKTFIAGGISMNNLSEYQKLGFKNFDVQSSVKNEITTVTENISYSKLTDMAKTLGYCSRYNYLNIGISVSNIMTNIKDVEYFDFVHIDISDGFIGEKTDLIETKLFLDYLWNINTNIKIHIHIFASNDKSLRSIIKALKLVETNMCIEIFVHVNFENYETIKIRSFHPAFDVSDILSDRFPIDAYFRDTMLVCLQKEDNTNRITNLNDAIKYLSVCNENKSYIYLDRGVDLKVIERLESSENIGIVIGRYFNDNALEKLNLIKGYLHAKE